MISQCHSSSLPFYQMLLRLAFPGFLDKTLVKPTVPPSPTHRRWDLFKPVWESSSASLSQTPLSVPEALPLSVTNVSRASRPVLMTPEELRAERQAHASGIFVAYHHQVGSHH